MPLETETGFGVWTSRSVAGDLGRVCRGSPRPWRLGGLVFIRSHRPPLRLEQALRARAPAKRLNLARAQSPAAAGSLALADSLGSAYPGLTPGATFFRLYGPRILGVSADLFSQFLFAANGSTSLAPSASRRSGFDPRSSPFVSELMNAYHPPAPRFAKRCARRG